MINKHKVAPPPGGKPLRVGASPPRGARPGVPRALKAVPTGPTLAPSEVQAKVQDKNSSPERNRTDKRDSKSSTTLPVIKGSLSRESSVDRITQPPLRAPKDGGPAPVRAPAGGKSTGLTPRGSRDLSAGHRQDSVGGGSGGKRTPGRNSSIGLNREPSIDSRQSSMMMNGDDYQMSADGDFRINSMVNTDDFSFLFPNEQSGVHQLNRLGFAKPLPSQAHFMAAFLSVMNNRSGKPYLSVQTNNEAGKTTGLALSLLSTLDSSSSALQAIILSSSDKKEFPDAMAKFASVRPLGVSAMVGPDIEENDVKQFARASQPFFPNILFGHPARIQNVVQNGQLELRSVSLFVMDDTADMLAKDLSTDVCQIAAFVQSKSRFRLKYISLSRSVPRDLRGTLLTVRKSLTRPHLSLWDDASTRKKAKEINHYAVCAPQEDWAKALQQIQQTMGVAKSIVFCDDDGIRNEVGKKLKDLKCSVRSLNDLINGGGAGFDNKGSGGKKRPTKTGAAAVGDAKDFVMSPTDALVLRDVLPKVSWIFHLAPPPEKKGDDDLVTNYGVRLTALPTSAENQAVSIFVSSNPDAYKKLEKRFGIDITELDSDFALGM